MSYDAVILDFDGVLVSVLDRKHRFAACFDLVLDGVGDLSLDRETAPTLSTGVSTETIRSLSRQLELAPERLWRLRDDLLAGVLRDAVSMGWKRPYPDTAVLAELTVPLGIASNNQQRVVESVLAEFGLAKRFETIHAREPRLGSLREKKPEPTLLRRARADLECSNPLYVGDKQTDVLAARRAGMDVAFVRREHNADRELGPAPTHEIQSLEELPVLFEGQAERPPSGG